MEKNEFYKTLYEKEINYLEMPKTTNLDSEAEVKAQLEIINYIKAGFDDGIITMHEMLSELQQLNDFRMTKIRNLKYEQQRNGVK